MAKPIHVPSEDRYSRFSLISWWDQRRLRDARVLVVGAGALGNEILKNLALLGIGHIAVVDPDVVELSNLSRSPLFREKHCGDPKVNAAASAVADLNPQTTVYPLAQNVVTGVGLGLFRWSHVVLAALDNREARLAINRYCALVKTPWIDGGIEVLAGVARVFRPWSQVPCYECTLSEVDWKILEDRRACSLLPRTNAPTEASVPTTPTTSAIVAGLQCNEALKILHGMKGLDGEGVQFDGVNYDSYRVTYTRNPDCLSHEPLNEIEQWIACISDVTVSEVIAAFRERLGPHVRVESCRDLIAGWRCSQCDIYVEAPALLDASRSNGRTCRSCGSQLAPELFHRLDDQRCLPAWRLADLGLPPWDILRGTIGDRSLGLEISGDKDRVLFTGNGRSQR